MPRETQNMHSHFGMLYRGDDEMAKNANAKWQYKHLKEA